MENFYNETISFSIITIVVIALGLFSNYLTKRNNN